MRDARAEALPTLRLSLTMALSLVSRSLLQELALERRNAEAESRQRMHDSVLTARFFGKRQSTEAPQGERIYV